MATAALPTTPRRRFADLVDVISAPVSPRTWLAQVHIVYDFWIGLAVFVALAALTGPGVASVCTIVLIPVFAWVLLVGARGLGFVERARYRATLGVGIPDPYPRFTGTFPERAWARLTCGAAWRELAYAIVIFPLAVVGFTATFMLWSGALAFTALPVYLWVLPDDIARTPVADIHPGIGLVLATLAGLAGLLAAAWTARGWAALDVYVARTLLGRGVTAELEDRVDVLQTTRSWALEVAEAERRRIERDLHDGAQQRLVALALDLGMAREKLSSDPDAARELIERAHGEAKAAIAEVRDLARGIHPPDLGETGLPGAIPVLAARSPLHVDVEVSVPDRPAPSIEGIVYFIVSECLTNVSKHARATRAGVRVVQQGPTIVVEVSDDGAGGAAVDERGSGLRGLAERVASVDGRFTVSSPDGGPTVVRAEVPCVS